MNVIESKLLTKQYKDIVALDQLSVGIPKNKIIGLIGKNGAGKSTFLKTCAGRIRHTSGDLHVLGEKVFDNLNVLSKMIFVDEESSYNTTYKVRDIIKLAKTYYSSWDDTLANNLLNHFGLNKDKKFRALSRGMRTQVNVIVGICSKMPLTILDEPTLGLDPAFRKDFYNILLTDFSNHPRTIIISSHLLNEIELLLDEVILIDKGKLLMHSSMKEFNEYSISLTGRTEFLETFVQNREVMKKSVLGDNTEYVVRNDLLDKDTAILSQNKIQIKAILPQELFILLTSKGEMFDGFQ